MQVGIIYIAKSIQAEEDVCPTQFEIVRETALNHGKADYPSITKLKCIQATIYRIQQ